MDNYLKVSPFDGSDQEKQSQVGRTEEVLVRESGNETKKGENDKISHQEKEQENNGKDSNDGDRKSQVSSQNNQKDMTEQNIAQSEKWDSSQMDKGDSQSKDNKEEGDNFNSVGKNFKSENGASWIQDA